MNTPLLSSFALLALASATVAQQPSYNAVQQAVQDQAVSTLPGGVMLSIPGVGTDFVIAGGGQFVKLPNGTARLTGRVFSESVLYNAFLVDILFQNRIAPNDPGYPPVGTPDLQLLPTAYTPSGSIDPSTFVYYTAASGTLTGVRNLDGAVLSLQLTGTPAQYGIGANNRNALLGLEASFQVTVVQQVPGNPFGVIGTAALLVDLPTHRPDDATHPQVDPTRSTLPFDRAMMLPGVADDYVFVPAGEFTEYDDGHAALTGTFARLTQLDDQWVVSLNLTGRIDPGEVGHPPAGSPVLQMLPSAYVGNGGTIDPSHWRYYQIATGTLVGQGINAGGSLTLTNNGAVQVGGAANQANTYFGYYGVFTTAIVTQPTGRTIGLTGDTQMFGLAAVFPVLPFPTLNTPAVPYALPTLTDQGIVIEGDNLAWTEYVGVEWDLVGQRDPSRWFTGYMLILDNQHIELHPRPGAVPGTYNLSIFNPAVRSNQQPLQLDAPTTPKLYSEAAVASGFTQHILVHSGTVTGPALSAIALSSSLVPTIYPGIVSLGIGDNNQSLLVFPGSYGHDPVTGITGVDLVLPPGMGPTLHFQAVTLDLGNFVLPLPVTNVWSVAY